MLASVLAATLQGIDGRPVRVEVDVAPGLPGFTIVGLADIALRESRERVRGALRNSGFVLPPRRITVNLAPADLPKAGSGLDLGIAIAVLVGSEQVTPRGRWAMLGELGLGGEVRPVPGLLPMIAALVRRGVPRVLVPADAAAEARLVAGIEVLPVETLVQAAQLVRGRRGGRGPIERAELVPEAPGGVAQVTGPAAPRDYPDLADVRGQAEARRALEIAVTGGHALILVGPPGSGKTLLARTIPGLLPPLDGAEAREATVIASVAGQGPLRGLVAERPFRAPHHTSSYAALVGGGPRLTPGEVTRAHLGTLFLDELPEFDHAAREALRQPLEEGRTVIARASGAVVMPARFQLVAAMNPCPCGWRGDTTGRCACPPALLERYDRKLSGPIRDRLDLWVGVPRVAPERLLGGPDPEPSAAVAVRVAAARALAAARSGALNSTLAGRALRAACALDGRSQARAIALADGAGLSARATERLLRVARTIADLAASAVVGVEHLEEAARFRVPQAAGMRDARAS
jgi:magnesium chelatase family protein